MSSLLPKLNSGKICINFMENTGMLNNIIEQK